MKKSKAKKLIIDFDRTIFDTDWLYQDLYELCEKRGLSRELLDYSQGLIRPNNLLFNFFVMVKQNRTIRSRQCLELVSELETFLSNEGYKYVFPDVNTFLDSASRDGYETTVLTYGDIDFQLAKYISCGFHKLNHNFIVTSTFKWGHPIMENSSSLLFLDDNPRDIDGVKKCFPLVRAIEIKRLNTKYSNAYSLRANVVSNSLDWHLIK